MGQVLLLVLLTKATHTEAELASTYLYLKVAGGTCTTRPMGVVSPNYNEGRLGFVIQCLIIDCAG